MRRVFIRLFIFASVLFFASAGLQSELRAESFVGSNVDSRVLVGFKVNSEGPQSMMPDGWTSIPFPGGPLKGANALLVFIDRKLQLDPEGKPADPANMRAVAVVGLGKEEGGDGVRLYVFRIYTTDPAPDPYENAVASEIARSTSVEGAANAGRMRKEDWNIAPEGGGNLTLSLGFTSGKRGWSSDEARPFSNTNPEFSRIYRYSQLVDLVMSAPIGKPMGGEFAFSSTIPEMAKIFDGAQELVAILDVPVYVREVYLP